ncbi:MAG: HutD family protein [Proteobacteria bacterium]|nr:HutD family protein [Pseudomonadota bacterium]
MQRLDLAAIAPTPWKNGGGATRELACWPPGAGTGAFDWRVSVASVAASGPFSAYPGVERQIMLLAGDGFHLQAPGGALDHRLDQPWQPLAFAGELAVQCRLLGGASTDFNLMLRRGRWQGRVQVLRQACLPGSTPAGLCLVLAGLWRRGGDMLTAGQGLWWSSAEAGAELAPQAGPGADEPVLAWVGLARI